MAGARRRAERDRLKGEPARKTSRLAPVFGDPDLSHEYRSRNAKAGLE
jgi:hypothetical protein